MCPADGDNVARRSRSIRGAPRTHAIHARVERVRQPRRVRLFRKAPSGQGGPRQPSATTGVRVPGAERKEVQDDEDRGCLSLRISEDPVMDAKQFDTIAKALIAETNRRRTLSGLLGGALASPKSPWLR